jgi:hypothetical protein
LAELSEFLIQFGENSNRLAIGVVRILPKLGCSELRADMAWRGKILAQKPNRVLKVLEKARTDAGCPGLGATAPRMTNPPWRPHGRFWVSP